MKTLPLPTMPITEEKTAVEYRLAEIEDETSAAHRDHAFEYWWRIAHPESFSNFDKTLAKLAFNRAHTLYCQPPKLVKIKPLPSEMFALYAIGVVSGIIIAIATFLLTVNPN